MTPQNLTDIISIFKELDAFDKVEFKQYRTVLGKYPKLPGRFYSKEDLVMGYKHLLQTHHPDLPSDPNFVNKIQLKPTRTISGVATVTVLTKPFPCPGECIFCPSDIRMPKSYLSNEPGAQRAEKNNFDPYLQTYRRIKALDNIGHTVEKIEVIILGGTWSFYPEKYQIWFIKRIFEALNDFSIGKDDTQSTEKLTGKLIIPKEFDQNFLSRTELDSKFKHVNLTLANGDTAEFDGGEFVKKAAKIANKKQTPYNLAVTEIIKTTRGKILENYESSSWEELEIQQKINETAKSRCVGLVIETRPDNISEKEVIRIRRLGCTKTQIGIQSLQDKVLRLNKRGHLVVSTKKAFRLLRLAGLKIHGHWMANLYGSTPEADILEYRQLFSDPDLKPDELKIYPCSLIETAELLDYYNKGLWKPYNYDELLQVVSTAIKDTPEYCRLTRVIRDIPGTDILVGNKLTNFREYAEKELKQKGLKARDIRSREIKGKTVTLEDLHLDIIEFETSTGTENFLQFITKDREIAGFLRLFLPKNEKHPFIAELDFSSIIREIHVYGKTVAIGDKQTGKAQHLGLGSKLIEKAKQISTDKGYTKMAVISAIGTREYYTKKGFDMGVLYQSMGLGQG